MDIEDLKEVLRDQYKTLKILEGLDEKYTKGHNIEKAVDDVKEKIAMIKCLIKNNKPPKNTKI